MAKFKDYSDQRFGRLVAMSFVGRKRCTHGGADCCLR
jgi:hypothetical protein